MITADRETCPYEVNEHDFARFESLLERVTWSGATERFDAFLFTGETVGLRRLEYVKSNVASSRRPNSSEPSELENKTETERTRRVVADIARWDAKAHALARQRLDADIPRDAAAAPPVRATPGGVRSANRSDVGREDVRGCVPPRSPYVWVKSGDVKDSGGVEPGRAFELHRRNRRRTSRRGIVFDPVTLTGATTPTCRRACVKGCTFDAPTT